MQLITYSFVSSVMVET